MASAIQSTTDVAYQTQISADDCMTVTVARNLEDLEALREFWIDAQSDPEADFHYFRTQFSSQATSIVRPHVISVRRGKEIIAILVGRIDRVRASVPIGYMRVPLWHVTCLTIIGPGLMGDASESTATTLMDAIRRSIGDGEADIALFHRLDVASHLYKALDSERTSFARDRFPIISEHWRANVSEPYADFLRKLSSNQRHNLKRYTTRFKQKYGDQIAIGRYREAHEIDRVMKDTEVVAQKTYQRGLGAGFMADNDTTERMRLYATGGRLRAYILYIDGVPVAFWHGFGFGDTFYTWTTGFDPSYGELRPGLFLLQELFIELCEDRSVTKIDFGLGDAQYKRELCDVSIKEATVYLFGSNPRGLLMNAIRTPLLGISKASKAALTKARLTDRVKRLWRQRMASRASANRADATKAKP